MNKLENLINQLEAQITNCELLNEEVSQSNVGWHIEHSLLVINGVIEFLIQSNPTDYKWKFNFTRFIIFTTGKIPRGRAKSPKSVKPKEVKDKNELTKELSFIRSNISQLDSASKDNYFDHSVFGMMNLKKTKKFLDIHTKHHLNIIEAIVKVK